MYLSPGTWVRFPRKAKTPIVKGVGEDREVAVPGTPKARAVTHWPPLFLLKGEKQTNMVVSGSAGSGQPQFISSTGNQNSSHAPLIDSHTTNTDQIVVSDRTSWKKLFA
ncbi:metal transporter Nramp6 [Trifolium repens]|nr:metal transporter Nramp6 [Trifolium repens]